MPRPVRAMKKPDIEITFFVPKVNKVSIHEYIEGPKAQLIYNISGIRKFPARFQVYILWEIG